MKELKEKKKDKDYTINLAEEILKKCHPDAVQIIKHWITIIQSRWDEVESWALQRQETLPDDLEIIRELITEHQGFMDGLTERQPEIDNVCKPMRPKSTAPSSRRASKAQGPGRDSEEPDFDPSRRQSQYDMDRQHW